MHIPDTRTIVLAVTREVVHLEVHHQRVADHQAHPQGITFFSELFRFWATECVTFCHLLYEYLRVYNVNA